MQRNLEALQDTFYDLLVVGGGIYGVCVARDAALRGLRVALIERHDFGAETSHNSLKIIHGGIRYIQHLDILRLLASAQERRSWMTAAPDLVTAQQFVIPLYGHGIRGPEAFGAAALIYNALTARIRGRQVPGAEVLSRERCAALMPSLDISQMSGGGAWYDGLMMDANRLLLACAENAARAGAEMANYLAAVDFFGPKNRVEGAVVEDGLTGRSLKIRASMTVNCAGPAASTLARRSRHGLTGETFAPLARAMNLVVDRPLTAGAGFGIASRRKSDAVVDRGGRMFFLVPWMSKTLVGTAHLPFSGEPDEYRFSEAEIQDFLDEINDAAPALDVARSDVVYCYAGLTPAAREDDVGEVKRRKRGNIIDHREVDAVDGLISLVSIKYTTARLVAERVVNHVVQRLDCAHARKAGSTRRLATASLPADPADERALAERCRAAIRDEMALRLEDVIFRRTRLGETGQVSERSLVVAAEAMGGTLGWDVARQRQEIADVQALLTRHRGRLTEPTAAMSAAE
jgi:glycerol-3-phosphate dehydrogenase